MQETDRATSLLFYFIVHKKMDQSFKGALCSFSRGVGISSEKYFPYILYTSALNDLFSRGLFVVLKLIPAM